MKTLIDRSYFYIMEDGVEEELGELLQLVPIDEPIPEDFIDACTVVDYYARNIMKVLEDLRPSETVICSKDEARKLVGLTIGGGYVAICKLFNDGFLEGYECELYYLTEDEL